MNTKDIEASVQFGTEVGANAADIDNFWVPLLSPEKQENIGILVRGSLAKQRESAKRLAQAKSRVEQLIEEAVRA
jgi:hypothetical protein